MDSQTLGVLSEFLCQVEPKFNRAKEERDSRVVARHDLRFVLGSLSDPYAAAQSLGLGKHLGGLDGLRDVGGSGRGRRHRGPAFR